MAPVGSLVDLVIGGDQTSAYILLPPGASVHDYALRPSDARAVTQADLVVFVGHGLTPWLPKVASSLVDADVLMALDEVPGTHLLTIREGAGFEGHGHHDHGPDEHDDDDGHDADGHDEGDHVEVAHEEHGHDDHGDEDHGDEDHGDGHDPHSWLDPDNAALWLGAIAEQLAILDPQGAALYRANAAAAVTDLDALSASIAASVPRDLRFLVGHDQLQYFEARFGVPAMGALQDTEDQPASAARIAALGGVADDGLDCVLMERGASDRLVSALDQSDVTVLQIDPTGAGLDPGPGLYGKVVEGIGRALARCRP